MYRHLVTVKVSVECSTHQWVQLNPATLPMWWYRLVGESMNADGINELHLLSGKGSGDIAAAALSVGFVEVAPGQNTVGAHNFYAWMH